MNRGIVQGLVLLVAVALSACSGHGSAGSLVPQGSYARPAGDGDVPFLTVNPVRQLCATPGTPERMQCFASVRTDVMLPAPITSQVQSAGETCPYEGEGYCPNDLQEAYNIPSLTHGQGKAVVIVDAYGYKHAAADLAAYRKAMGLKACTTATKCLRIVNQEGNASPLPPEPPPSDDWRGEQSLDLDMVSALCPNCKIILVQTRDNYTSDLYAGVKTADGLGPKYIGVSWGGGPEGSDNPIFHPAGKVIAAAAGDNGGGGRYGGGPIQPCTYTYVVCVGGTHLVRDQQKKRGWNETVWNDWNFDYCSGPCGATGSACSKKIAKPA